MKKNAFDPVRVRIWALTGLMGLCLLAFAGVMIPREASTVSLVALLARDLARFSSP